jgi:hypothetical protein
MMPSPPHSIDYRLLLPEIIWLEPEHFDQAKAMSHPTNDEKHQWDTYLHVLALLGFETWLQEQLPDQVIQPEVNQQEGGYFLRIGEFKVCILATEQVLDEVVNFSRPFLDRPELAAHFYVVLEVLEEQEQAIIRGFLQHDELMSAYDQAAPSAIASEVYSLPLSALDAEINHLIIYTRYSAPSPLSLSEANVVPAEPTQLSNFQADLTDAKTRLSQWLQGTLAQGWQTIDALINPEANLALSPRQAPSGAKGGKLINFGMQLGRQTVALVVTVVPEEGGKLGVGVQVLPVGGASVVPPQLKLSLLSAAESVLQEVQSREQDNYIQLKPFKGKPGTHFSIEVRLNNIKVKEAFEI